MQCEYKGRLRRVRVTIVATETQQYFLIVTFLTHVYLLTIQNCFALPRKRNNGPPFPLGLGVEL